MGHLIEERTKGRHSLRVFHSRQLGEEKETIEQTRVGAIDLNRTNIAPLASFVPLANRARPCRSYFVRSSICMRCSMGRSGRRSWQASRSQGFIGLTFYDSGARSIYTRNRAVRTLDDLKGLRIRVQQSDLMVDMVEGARCRAGCASVRASRDWADHRPHRRG